MCVCACVRVCVRACISLHVRVCALVFGTHEDTNLYNNMGMTQVLEGEGYLLGHFLMSPYYAYINIMQNAYKSYRISFLEKLKMLKGSCKG